MPIFYMPRSAAYSLYTQEFSGALLYFYEAGTSTPKSTYTDFEETIANDWPVVANSNGIWPAIYLTGTFKVVVQTSEGVTIYTQDNLNSREGQFTIIGDFDSSTNSGNYPSSGFLGAAYRCTEEFTLGSDSGSHFIHVGDYIVANTSSPGALDADWDILRGVNDNEQRGPIGTGSSTAGQYTLSTAETTIVSGDYLGKLNFQAPLESSGGDAIVVSASIWAVAEIDFTATDNTTALVFGTNESGIAAEQMRLKGNGNLYFVNDSVLYGQNSLTIESIIFADNTITTGSSDTDIIFEGGSNPNLLYIDRGSDMVGVGVSPTQALDVLGNIKLSNNRTASTAKASLLLSAQYDSEVETEGYSLLYGYGVASNNIIRIGGGHGAYNAATVIDFYTAPDVVTRIGTHRARFDSTGNFVVGTDTALAKLHVYNGDSGVTSLSAAGNDGFFESNANTGITLGSPAGNSGNIIFADSDSSVAASIQFDHSINTFINYIGGTAVMRLDAKGLGVGISPIANQTSGQCVLEGGALILKEITTPTADTNYGKIYTKTDNILYFQDGAGAEHALLYSGMTAASLKVTNLALGMASVDTDYLILGAKSTGNVLSKISNASSMSNGNVVVYIASGGKVGPGVSASFGLYYNSGSDSDNACGYLSMPSSDGDYHYLWVDDNGIFRNSTTIGNIGTTNDGFSVPDGGGVFSNGLRVKVLNIGDWNMDSSHISGNIAHGLGSSYSNIVSISAFVRDDSDSNYYPLFVYYNVFGTGAPVTQGWVYSIDSTNIVLCRATSGDFDSTSFDSTSYNRGYLTIMYSPA